MAKRIVSTILATLMAFGAGLSALGCTSAIVSGTLTESGLPILWKNRDSSATHSFLARTEPTDSTLGFVGLHNAGDSLLREVWIGVNDAGFAIMNTASYNLAEPDPDFADREGLLMAKALATCRSVDDFAAMLDAMPRPLGVEANFGVTDAAGHGAFFEVDNASTARFDLSESEPVLVRTNFSVSGDSQRGYGYTRYDNACRLLADAPLPYSPATFVEGLSCSFLNARTGHDPMSEGDTWAVDQDFIPRASTSASVAIQGGRLWVVLGYPPTGRTLEATATSIPAALRPNACWSSDEADEAWQRRSKAFPLPEAFDHGDRYVNLDAIREMKNE